MSEFNKYSTDGGATFIDVEDSEAVHYGEQSKGYVGKNLFNEIYEGKVIWGNNQEGFNIDANTNGCTVGSIIKKNTSYTITKQGGNRFRLVLWGTKPTIPSNTPTLPSIEVVYDNTLTEYTFNSGNYEYCALTCNNVDAYVLDDIKAMLRLSSRTDSIYEPYLPQNTEINNKVEELTGKISGIYAKTIKIPTNSDVRITATEDYQQFFGFTQRNIAFVFWNRTIGADLTPAANNTSTDMPSVSFVSNRVTDLHNPMNAPAKVTLISYSDFTVS